MAMVYQTIGGADTSLINRRRVEAHDLTCLPLEAGNSSQMIFQHYRELVTEKEAKRWFAITPDAAAEVRAEAERRMQKAEAANIVAFPAKTEHGTVSQRLSDCRLAVSLRKCAE